MFCITSVEFLMEAVKSVNDEAATPSGFRVHNTTRGVVFCRVVPRFFSIVLSSVDSRITPLRCTVRKSWFPSCSSSLFSRIVFIAVSSVGFSTICNRGPWPLSGPCGVATTVRVDARFQGTVVRGFDYPICRRSPCGPRRQFDIGGFPVSVKVQSKLRVVFILLLIQF